VVARYRKGTGVAGLVAADQLSLVPERPRGLRAVRNPLAAQDAQDPEDRDAIRGNASLGVLTLDRLVSLRDHEDFARAFGGIAKALGTWTWDGEQRAIFVTMAGTAGALVPFDAPDALGTRLLSAMRRFGVPFVPLRAASFRPVLFRLEAELGIDPDDVPADVLSAARSALAERFGFDARALGHPVVSSQIVAVLHDVPGVVAVDVNALYRLSPDGASPSPTRAETLVADAPHPGERGAPAAGAELLTIDPHGIDLRRRG
jgi:predicted phage baseplate assembly protein